MDGLWALIEAQQHEALDKMFLSKMPLCYNSNYVIAMLCLVCHAGKEMHVPCCGSKLAPATIMEFDFRHVHLLGIYHIDFGLIGTDGDQYRQCLMRFLQDSERSGKFAVGADAYTAAAIFFIGQLELIDWTNEEGPFDENRLLDQLIHANGMWRFEHREASPFEVAFLCLGYLIFFLPRAGISVELLQYCQQKAFLTKTLTMLFPKRTTLLRRVINDYLEYVQSRALRRRRRKTRRDLHATGVSKRSIACEGCTKIITTAKLLLCVLLVYCLYKLCRA